MQILRILRKDALHLWPEILISILLLVAFAWLGALTWQPNLDNATLIAFASGLLRFLIVVSWLMLTSRLVHDEELVGDRQFWITRPYTWYSLLLSKVLSLLTFICLPFLIMQMWMLHHAGLYPTQVLPALLKDLFQVAGFVLLVMLAIAAATATFIRYASSVLVGIIYALAVVGFVAYKWPDNFAAPYMQYPINTVVLGLLVAALLFSYARRKTLIARLLLVAIPIAVILVLALAPINALISHRYPDTSLGQLQYVSDAQYQQTTGNVVDHSHTIILHVPVQAQLTALPANAYAAIQVVRTTVDGPNGYHFDTGWGPTTGTLSSRDSISGIFLRLPDDVYDKLKGQPVAMHITLGVQAFTPGTPYIVNATPSNEDDKTKRFPLSGNATCTVSAEDGTLECRFPLHSEYLTNVTAPVNAGTCAAPGPVMTYASGTLPAGNAFFDPVEIEKTTLSVGQRGSINLCPNTPLTFTQDKPAQYARMSVDIPAITLDGYAMRLQPRK